MIVISRLLIISLLASTIAHANLSTELDKKSLLPQIQAPITFDKKNINAHPELKDKFIEFASLNLDSQDAAMLTSIVHLVKKYPQSCKEEFSKKNSVLNPAIQQVFNNQKNEKDTPHWHKMFSFGALFKTYLYVRPFLNIYAFPTFRAYHKDTGKELWVNEEKTEADLLHDNAKIRLHGVGLMPYEQWPRIFISGIITRKIMQLIQERAKNNWGYNFEIPEYNKNSWNVEGHASAIVQEYMWMGVGGAIGGYVVNPLMQEILP